jgi:type II secretory pathway pseudopilin PulG
MHRSGGAAMKVWHRTSNVEGRATETARELSSFRRLTLDVRALRAFTIVELMLALGIFAMILVTIYAVWNGILRSSSAARAAADSAQRARIAVRTIEDALNTAQMFAANMPPQNPDAYYSFLADGSGDFAALSFVAHLPASFPGVGHYGDDIVRRVTFTCEQDKDGVRLVMRQGPMMASMEKDFEPYSLVLAKDVQTFLIDFWGQPKDSREFQWVQEWNSTNALPKLVRIALGIGKTGKKGEAQDVVYRVIALPATAVAPEWQMPMGPIGGGLRPNPNQQNPRQNPNLNGRNPFGR